MPPGTVVGSWAMLLPETMPGFVALQQEGSVTTKGQVDIPGLGCHTGGMLMSEGCAQLAYPSPEHQERSGPGGIIAGELSPTLLAICSTQESRPANSWSFG